VKDLQSILKEIQQLEAAGEPYVLATIVQISGSAYRGPGTRMLITQDGRTVGTISGGCLERDVLENAAQVFENGVPLILTYDSTSEDDILWGTGLGCSGIVQVLLEKLPQSEGPNYPRFLADCVRHQKSGVLATIFEVAGAAPPHPVQRLLLHQDLCVEDDIADKTLQRQILQSARRELEDLQGTNTTVARSKTRHYETHQGRAAVLLEPLLPPVPLVIFGAGHDACPVVRLASELGWQVTVVDHRPAFARPERLPEADAVLLARPPEAFETLQFNGRSTALLMTHNYMQDLEVLQHLLTRRFHYLGLLGPLKRTQRLLDDLKKQGIEPTEDQLPRLFSPVGLDLGAETAEEIALSIVGEIQAALTGRPGGQLRRHKGPIHDRPS
jgi:xanthine dehydrogenase accessory factor